MADPLLAKLDRLMRQMERGQLLEDEQGDAPGGELDNGRRAPRRQRQQQAKPFKNWDSGSTSYKLPEYDALRDPHCRYTKQRQFKQQWDKFSKAAMIQEVLRGDHAALLDVMHATKKKGAKKKATRRGPRPGLTDGSGYGMDGRARRKKNKMTRKRSPNGNDMRLPNVGRPAAQRRGSGRRGRGNRGGRVPGAAYYGAAAPSASPSAPMRDDFSMDAPSLPPMFSNGAEMRGRRKRRNKGGNESWKRTGATSSVNAAVLRYRNKRGGKASGSGGVDGSSPGVTSATHGDRVEREYLRARQSSKRYRKKAQLDALRKKALLPPMPDATNFSPRGTARERRRREQKEHAGALDGSSSERNSVSTLPPEPKATVLPSPERAREDQMSDLAGTPATLPAKRSLVNDAAPEFSPTAPNSPDSPGGGYSDEDFEDEDEEGEEDEEVYDKINQSQGQGQVSHENKAETEVKLKAKSVAVSQPAAGANVSSPQQEQRQAQEMQRQQAKGQKAESVPQLPGS